MPATPAAAPLAGIPGARDLWLQRESDLLRLTAEPAAAFVKRRDSRQKHPVDDFLFTYYSFPPAKLTQWSPALGETLVIHPADLESRPHWRTAAYQSTDSTLALDPTRLSEKTRSLAAWIASLCTHVLQRPAHFRCFGLHEWAMVYQQTEAQIRHQGHRLRLSPGDLAAFVDSQKLCCTHYDAYRFFTPAAAPRNTTQPTLDTRLSMEQAGCLHTNMDLYKWSAKLWPWIGSDLIGQTFALAREGRTLDMRASPYDLTDLGYPPIAIETPEGRTLYEQHQRALTAKATPLRAQLATLATTLATP